jgi:hypothetical protein
MKVRRILALVLAPAFAVGVAACDVDQRQEGEMPDIEVEGGQMPQYDVDLPDVEVNRDTVTVPDIDINAPDDDGGR